MSSIEETIFTDLWRRYFEVMRPFQIDLGDGYTGHVIPQYSDGEMAVDAVVEDEDVELIYSVTHAYVTVTHPNKAPFIVETDSRAAYIACDENGNLFVNEAEKERLIHDIRRVFFHNIYLSNSGKATPHFSWRASPLIWGAAGRDDRFRTSEGINEAITTSFIRNGFEPFIKNVFWGSASTTIIDSFEEAIQIDYCMDDKIRSTNAKVLERYMADIPEGEVTRLKYKITKNFLGLLKQFYHGYITTDKLKKEFPFMEVLLTDLAVCLEDFLKSIDVDWDVCLAFSNELMFKDETFIRKYEMIQNSPAITVTDKNGNEKTINPRREFVINYPLVMTFKDSDALEALFVNYVDKLEELPPLTLLHDREGLKEDALTPAKQKYIAGKFIHKNGRLSFEASEMATFINVALRTLPVSKLPKLAVTPFDKNSGIWFILNETMRTLFHVMLIRSTPSGKENINRERLLDLMPRMTDDEVKSYPNSEISSDLFYMALCHHDVFGELLKKYGSIHAIYDKVIQYGDVKDSSSDRPENMYEIINIIDSDLNDVIDNIFVKKVVIPAIFHFAGKNNMKEDANTQWEKVALYRDILQVAHDILLYDRFPLIEMLAMNKHVHDRETRFMDAGNNPESLKESMSGGVNADEIYLKITELLEKSNASINEDQYRRRFELSKTASWFSLFDNTLKTKSGNLIVPLLTSSELKEEGNAMNNCVGWGSYTKQSKNGDLNIFSVRKPDGKRLATLEVSMRDDGNSIVIAVKQLRGYHNSFLDDADSHDIKDAINCMKEKLTEDHKKTENFRKYMKLSESIPEEQSPVEEAGYGFHDYESLKAAFEPWIPYLPKCMKKPDDFMMIPSFKRLVEFTRRTW